MSFQKLDNKTLLLGLIIFITTVVVSYYLLKYKTENTEDFYLYLYSFFIGVFITFGSLFAMKHFKLCNNCDEIIIGKFPEPGKRSTVNI